MRSNFIIIWLTDKFKAYGTHGFVFVSTHRVSEKSFATVGLGARGLHGRWGKENDGCLWVSLDGPKGISVRTPLPCVSLYKLSFLASCRVSLVDECRVPWSTFSLESTTA